MFILSENLLQFIDKLKERESIARWNKMAITVYIDWFFRNPPVCFWCIWPYGFTLACIVINGNLIITSSIINNNTAWPGQRVKLSGPAVSISSILLRHHTVPTINKQTHWELMCQTSLSAWLLSTCVNRGLLYMIKILCFPDWSD